VNSWRAALRWALVGLVLALVVVLACKLRAVHELAAAAERARGAGPSGVLAVFAAFVGLTFLVVPLVPMTMACGFIYGMPGAAVAVSAMTTSAALAFLGGRAIGGERLASALENRPRLRALAELAQRGGAVTVALLRVSPILPFMPSNAALGMTGLRLRDMVLGTAAGVLPGAVLLSAVGSLLPDAAALERGEAPRGPFWAMLALGVIAMATIATAAARKLRKLTA
jgi:uncharacterized membrane protein YdjX (TVP38/TMEM64 family)